MAVTFITYKDGHLHTKSAQSEFSIKQYQLICDRLTLTCDFPIKVQDVIINNFMQEKAWPQGNYNLSNKVNFIEMTPLPYELISDDEDKLTSAYIQCAPKKKNIKFLRLDFNPAKADLATLIGSIQNNWLTVPGYGYKHLIEHGTVTRIDLAVDIAHENINEFLYHYPKMRRVEVVRTKSGRTEYMGGKYKSSKRIVIYDRIPAIKYSNSKYMDKVYHEPVPDMPILRIEFRISPNMKFKDILKLDNPFTGLQLSAFKKLQAGQDSLWDLFLALARFEGAQATLGRLTKQKKKEFKERLGKGAIPWWKPDMIWGQFPSVIKSIKFFSN